MRSIDGIRGRRKKQGKGTESKQKLKEETQQSKKKKKTRRPQQRTSVKVYPDL